MMLNHCLLLTYYDKEIGKTVEKFFGIRIVDHFYPLKIAILASYSMFYSKYSSIKVTWNLSRLWPKDDDRI